MMTLDKVETVVGTLEIEGEQLYYEVAGAGPVLVLGHAGFVDNRMWDDQWAEFAQQYRVIRYDMRGYGKSDPVRGPVARGADLARLLTHLDVERAILVGCSMSGEAMLDYMLEHPDQVAALVLVNSVPSGFEMQGAPPPEIMEMIGALQQGDLARVAELQLRIWIDGPTRHADQVDATVRARAGEMNKIAVQNNTWATADAQPADPLDPPAVSRLAQVRVPTLVVAGALDYAENLRAADLLAAEIPNAQKVVLAHSADVPSMEQPVEFNRAVLDFLATVR